MCSKCAHRDKCSGICRKVEKLLPDPDKGKIYFNGHDPHEVLAGINLNMRRVRDLLAGRDLLRGRMRTVFDLRFNEGLTQEQIAVRLGCSRSTARRALERAVRAAFGEAGS